MPGTGPKTLFLSPLGHCDGELGALVGPSPGAKAEVPCFQAEVPKLLTRKDKERTRELHPALNLSPSQSAQMKTPATCLLHGGLARAR